MVEYLTSEEPGAVSVISKRVLFQMNISSFQNMNQDLGTRSVCSHMASEVLAEIFPLTFPCLTQCLLQYTQLLQLRVLSFALGFAESSS